MNQDDDNIKLRDQFAMQIMQAIITLRQPLKNYSWYNNGTLPNTYTTINEFGNDFKMHLQELEKDMELISDFSYKMADYMRKSRLKSFT